MKKHSSTLILLGFTVLVSLYAYFFEFKKKHSDEEKKQREALIFQVKKESIVGLKFKSENAFELKRVGDTWRIVRPVDDLAESGLVNSFLDSLLVEKSEMEISDDQIDFSIYDLKNPKYSFEVETSDQKVTSFYIGTDALESKRYLRVNQSNSVLVGSMAWQNYATKSMKDFRSKVIVRNSFDQLKKVEVENRSKGTRLFISKQDGKWAVENPKFDIDSRQVEAFITQIQNMRGQEIAFEDKKNLAIVGLSKPKVTLSLTFEGESEPLILSIGAQQLDKSAYLISSQLKPIYYVYGAFADGFGKSALDFRDREKPFQFDLSRVHKIDLSSELFSSSLVKQDGEWKLATQNDKKNVDQAQVSSLLTQLSRLRAREFLTSGAPFKAKKSIQLRSDDGTAVFEVKIGSELKQKNQYFISSSLSKEVMTVDDEAIKALPFSSLVVDKPEVPSAK
jgi:hypothetical protein